MKIKASYISILAFGIAAGLTLLATVGCHGRKVKAELVQFSRTIEESRTVGDTIVMEFDNLSSNSEQMNQPDVMAPKIKDLTDRIDTMLAPVKAMNPRTKEVQSLRDNWIKAWESFRDALDLVYRVISTRDKNLAYTIEEQLRSKMMTYEQSSKAFEDDYKALMEKFKITYQDIGAPPAVTPIAPMAPPSAKPTTGAPLASTPPTP